MANIENLTANRLTPLLRQQTDNRKTPGIFYACFDAENIHFQYTGGMADLATTTPVDAQTAFYGFSMTKTFTATAVMQLAEQGKLLLDSPVKTYLPDFGYGEQITVRHLLSHSAGIPNPLPVSWIHPVDESRTFDESAFFDAVFQKNNRPKFGPGEKFAYSNLGYIVLGRLIERCSGLPYRQYVEEKILQPLGIGDRLGFTLKDHLHTATGYQKTISFGNLLLGFMLDRKKYMGNSVSGWTSFRPFYVNGPAYGGLIGQPRAFIQFAQDLLKKDSLLLSPESKKAMFTENLLNNGRPSGMCLGWFTGMQDGHRFVTHAGGGGGFYCELRIYPEAGAGSLMMTNRSGFSDERLSGRFDRVWLV